MIREQIQRTATSQFVRYGVKQVKMDHIACQLHISKKTIYEHFSSKGQLFDTCVRALIEQDRREVARIVHRREQVVRSLLEVNQLMMNRISAFSPTFISDLREYNEELRRFAEGYRSFVEQVYAQLLCRGMEEGLFVPETDCQLIPKLFDTLMELIFSHPRQREGRQMELYRFTIITLLTGFCTEQGRQELNGLNSTQTVSNINL